MRLFEFEDVNWFPSIIRDGMTDYLRFILNTGNLYKPVTPVIVEALQATHSTQIIDLCSGGGGTIQQIQKNIVEEMRTEIKIVLTDKFPNIPAFKVLQAETNGSIEYMTVSVDAMCVPLSLNGLRTIFSGFHHFDKEAAKKVIQNAVDADKGIAIFDGGNKGLLFIIGMIIFHLIFFIFLTPFIRPFKWSRLLFTYFVPLIPLCTIWDGTVSITRLYKPVELSAIADSLNGKHYIWRGGYVKNRLCMRIAYLVGYPKNH